MQVPLPLQYKGRQMGVGYRLDVVVEGVVIVEIMVVRAIAPIYLAQVLTYPKLAELALGMISNFGETRMEDGIKRVANGI